LAPEFFGTRSYGSLLGDHLSAQLASSLQTADRNAK
jgi:hypothetical protein